jgi:hypothetical protein
MNNGYLVSACGTTVCVNDILWKHAERHPGITYELLEEAVQMITIDLSTNQERFSTHLLFDRTIGRQGLIYNSNAVELDETIWFGLRQNRLAPTPILPGSNGHPTNYLFIYLNQIDGVWTITNSYPSSGPDAMYPGTEPISFKNSRLVFKGNENNLIRRKLEALQKWRHFSIAEYTTVIEGELFQSTWNEVMEKYWSVYDTRP